MVRNTPASWAILLFVAAVTAVLLGGRRAGAAADLWARRDVIRAPNAEFARVADLDGDGDLDFLAVEYEGNKVVWWENNGDGSSFTDHTIIQPSREVRVVSPGDLDGDGDVDFLTLSPDRMSMGVWLNDGSGAFTEVTGYAPQARNVVHVEAADVNGDSRADYFTVLGDPGGIDYFESGPGPDFAFTRTRVASAAQAAGIVRVDAADMDGDGLVDLASAGDGKVNWWRQGGAIGSPTWTKVVPTGLIETEVTDVSAADIDGDGRQDLFTLRKMEWRVYAWLAGEGEFAKQSDALASSEGGKRWRSLDSGDVNGDGAPDFVVTELTGELCWYLNPAVDATATPTRGNDPSATPTASLTPRPPEVPVGWVYLPLIRNDRR